MKGFTRNQMARVVCMLFTILLIRPLEGFTAGDMVEIAIEITEVNTTKANELGIKWLDTVQAGEVSLQGASRLPEYLPDIPTIIGVADWTRFTPLTAELKILAEKGAAQVLSKPKLVTRSGTTAKFIVGGEFPVTAVGATAGTIEWKEYGIKTDITPKILADGSIELVMTTEVSRLDWSNKVQGYPAMIKRQAASTVCLASGQTVALAGLIETTKATSRSGIPLLSDIPVLGVFFSRQSMVETKTNVLIFVTPKILD